MEIKTSKLISKKPVTLVKASKASPASQDVQDEIKLLLVKHALTLDNILGKYKEVLDSGYEKPKASDILNLLASVTKLHGITSAPDQASQSITIMLQDKSTHEVINYLHDLTSKTSEYLDKLQASTSKPIVIKTDKL